MVETKHGLKVSLDLWRDALEWRAKCGKMIALYEEILRVDMSSPMKRPISKVEITNSLSATKRDFIIRVASSFGALSRTLLDC